MGEHISKEVSIDGNIIKIDVECIQLVLIFNYIGLKTKHSCQGDDLNYFNIMFKDDVDDNDIIRFLEQFENKYHHSPFRGKFVKWTRKMCGEIVSNWMYQSNSIRNANYDYNIIKSKYNKSL